MLEQRFESRFDSQVCGPPHEAMALPVRLSVHLLDTDHCPLSSLIPPLTHWGEASRTPSPAEQPHLVEPWLLSPALPDHPQDTEGRSPLCTRV